MDLGISIPELMEKAGISVVEAIEKAYKKQPVQVICGPGNNGGDGYVVARHLQKKGWPVTVMGAEQKNPPSSKTLWNGPIQAMDENQVAASGIIVDAIFGLGLSKPLRDIYEALVKAINHSKALVVAVDIPSGIQSDTGEIMGYAVKADLTVTFNFKKPGQVLIPGRNYCGSVVVKDIGLKSPAGELICENHPNLWKHLYPFPTPTSHKYNRGYLAILGGSQITGAARLAAEAARRIGAGLVQIQSLPDVYALYKQECLGVLTREIHEATDFAMDPRFSAALIGPGSGRTDFTHQVVLSWLQTKKPCVLDADALYVFKEDPQKLFNNLHDKVILVPHEGEFSYLFERRVSKIESALEAATISNAVVLLKGADTVIAHPNGRVLVQTQDSPYLATGGTGDVLAGMIAGLLAENVDSLMAAGMGAFVHVKVAQKIGLGLIAEDIAHAIPSVLKDILTRD